MARVRQRYYRGDPLNALKIKLNQSIDNGLMFVQRDRIHVNGFSDLILYIDAAGTSPIPLSSYEAYTVDSDWTTSEVGFTNKTIYSQYRITDATYWSIDVYADFTDFGVYTDVDAEYAMVGGNLTISSGGTITPPDGYTDYTIIADASIGGFTVAIANGSFDGQRVTVYVGDDATALVYVTGVGSVVNRVQDGIYVGPGTGTPISAGRSLFMTWNSTLSIWIVQDGVTADYPGPGPQPVLSYSTGNMSISGQYTGAGGATIIYAVPFSAVGSLPLLGISSTSAAETATTNLETATNFVLLKSSNGSIVTFKKEGKF